MKLTHEIYVLATEATIERTITVLKRMKHIESVTKLGDGIHEKLEIIVPDDYTHDDALRLGALIGQVEGRNMDS
jgi:hypothetical protein